MGLGLPQCQRAPPIPKLVQSHKNTLSIYYFLALGHITRDPVTKKQKGPPGFSRKQGLRPKQIPETSMEVNFQGEGREHEKGVGQSNLGQSRRGAEAQVGTQ